MANLPVKYQMKFNICIIQPQGYIHSLAFLELAELLVYSLRDLNHDAALQRARSLPSMQWVIIPLDTTR